VTSGPPGLMKSKQGKLAGLPEFVRAPDPSIYLGDNYVVLDFETTTIFKGSPLVPDNRIVMASWRTPDGEVHSHFGSEYDQSELVAAVESADFLVAHNAKFELGWLRRCGVDLRSLLVYDTMVGEYIIGGNRFPMVMLGLDKCLARYGLAPKLSIPSLMLKAGFCTTTIPESWLQSYCETDVRVCHELFLKQRAELSSRSLLHLQYQRCLLCPVLADIEFNGMQLDEAAVDAAIGELEDDYARITSELQEFMGGVPPASTKQKGDYVFNVLKFSVPRDHKGKPMLTKSGTPSIAAEVLKRLRPTTKRQEQFLAMHTEWAKMHSDLTKYLRKFKECCVEADGQLRAVFNQCATRTHRLSSSGLVHKVQFQNLNRKFKPIFKARNPGWFIGEADGAQLEFRIATHMGRDRQALTDILDPGFDAHVTSAAAMNDIEYSVLFDLHQNHDEKAGFMRQEAKPDTFKPLYGGTSGTPKQMKWYKYFAERYSGIADTQRGWTHKVLNEKKLTTEYGLVFHWPDCKMTKSGWILHTTNIYNYPIQGFATAEIIPLAIICAWHRMKDMQSFLVNTVHDSIIAELHPEERELWHDIAKQCLIDDCYALLSKLYKIKLTVPLGAGVMIGSHWSNKEAKASEVTYSAPADHYEEAAKEAGML
jgi:DNA polymerase I-like protein with 3'-5' exonuclease and polymerase domains